MVNELGWLYLVGGTVLFFFWAYGIVSFVRDCRNRFVPAIGRLVEARRRKRVEEERKREREERERQLY